MPTTARPKTTALTFEVYCGRPFCAGKRRATVSIPSLATTLAECSVCHGYALDTAEREAAEDQAAYLASTLYDNDDELVMDCPTCGPTVRVRHEIDDDGVDAATGKKRFVLMEIGACGHRCKDEPPADKPQATPPTSEAPMKVADMTPEQFEAWGKETVEMTVPEAQDLAFAFLKQLNARKGDVDTLLSFVRSLSDDDVVRHVAAINSARTSLTIVLGAMVIEMNKRVASHQNARMERLVNDADRDANGRAAFGATSANTVS